MELPPVQPSLRPDVAVSPIPATAESPVPALRLWGIRRSITLAVLAALLLVGAMIAAALWYAGWPSVKRDATVTPATLFDLLKLVFAVVAGIGGVAALVVAYRRQRVAEHTNQLAEFAHQLAHAADIRAEVTKSLAEAADERAKVESDRNGIRLLNERFAQASEQLGSEKAAVRLAGVYALAGLADDWREGRQTCIDVLCAYLRMPYIPPGNASAKASRSGRDAAGSSDEAARLAREEREVRHTLVRLMGRHLRLAEDDPTSWRGFDFDFTGAVLDGGDFSSVHFSSGRVSFAGVTFAGTVTFNGAVFSGGEVTFRGATFSHGRVSFARSVFSGGVVSFTEAIFSGGDVAFPGAAFSDGEVSFLGARFEGASVSFLAAKFSGAEMPFDGASFRGGRVSFSRARFTGGSLFLDGAAFTGAEVSFEGATFSGAELSFVGAVFTGADVSFQNARFSGGSLRLNEAKLRVPPKFDDWPEGRRPAVLHLP